MIITLPAQKDTYVTNLKTQNFDAAKSNLGNAATLDFFKLHNENKNAKSWAVLQFPEIANDGDIIKLIDANGLEKIYEFNNDNVLIDNQHVSIDIQGEADNSNYANIIKLLVNADDDIDIVAYSNSNNELLLKQNKPGESGDTLITMPNSVTCKIAEQIDGVTYGKFSRIEYSFAAIKFDLNSLKSKYMKNINFANSAFNNLSAQVVLKDVTSGHTKPKNYDLQIYSLNKDFEEGTGKDTIYFSDTQSTCNFTQLSSSSNWSIPSYVSQNDDVDKILNNVDDVNTDSKIKVSLGNEDLIFDVTDYVKEKLNIANDAVVADNGFLIGFSEEYLFDKKSYFVKRTGTKHLNNKSLVPTLSIKIPDHEYLIPRKTFTKNRFLNNPEEFFLYNITNGKTLEFKIPDLDINAESFIKLRITNIDETVTFVDNIATENIVNYLGNSVPGIKKASITDVDISIYNNLVSENILNDILKCKLIWYVEEGETQYVILKESVDFKSTTTGKDNSFRSLKSTVKIENYELIANGSIIECCAYFVDLRASHDPVKLPYDLPSQNIGNVRYQIINQENSKVLIDFDNNTYAYYDGEKYIFNVCLPEIYEKFNIRFNFEIEDIFTKSKNIIYNNTTFKVK